MKKSFPALRRFVNLLAVLAILVAGTVSAFPHIHFSSHDKTAVIGTNVHVDACSTCALIHAASNSVFGPVAQADDFSSLKDAVVELASSATHASHSATLQARAPPLA